MRPSRRPWPRRARARMIGGGFGGSVLALTPAASGDSVRAAVTEAFTRHGWTAPEFLDAAPRRVPEGWSKGSPAGERTADGGRVTPRHPAVPGQARHPVASWLSATVASISRAAAEAVVDAAGEREVATRFSRLMSNVSGSR